MKDLKQFGRLMLMSAIIIIGYKMLGFEYFVVMSIAFIMYQMGERIIEQERER